MIIHKAWPLTEPLAEVGECPVYVRRSGVIAWVDLTGAALLVTDIRSRTTVRHALAGRIVALVREHVDGGLVVAIDADLWRLSFDGATNPIRLASFPMSSGMSPNDGACSADGSLWLGLRGWDGVARDGLLCRVGRDRVVQVELSDLRLPNGLVFSVDPHVAFLVDSLDQKIWRLTLDQVGSVESTVAWADLSGSDAVPDGMAMDSEGGLWVAMWGGGEVRRYDQRAKVTDVVELPASLATACCFGDNGALYITTSNLNVSVSKEPLAGALFVASTPYHGAEVFPCAVTGVSRHQRPSRLS